MSSSCGEPSRKMGWYRSMLAKFKNENKVKDQARRVSNIERRKQERENQVYGG
jgi:hypothetical protein